ncbi:subtilisin [Nitrogeniibacter mangrovi]|uniref:Subtilisin n=1 Tax=Nitrogeniibacter mangrovi TaxID=2016596 RepID=A0A6C1B041_9RHOO|nr:S8 family serine peptidase [Nitrogeniibacter mangrovi]QID16178.1 subtilisin [Nitrogeniibacter mangrovi]
MKPRIRVGLIDGAVAGEAAPAVVESRRFNGLDAADGDHGGLVAQCVLEHCAEAELIVAQVFDRRRVAPVAAIVDAIDWLVERDVAIINMSFGMAHETPLMAAMCRYAAGCGATLVAAAPAHGPAAFPARLDACLAVTGDARCQRGEIAYLGTANSDFGTHPFVRPGQPQAGGGASIATARMSGLVAARVAAGVPASRLRQTLIGAARHVGPEVRHG